MKLMPQTSSFVDSEAAFAGNSSSGHRESACHPRAAVHNSPTTYT